MTNTLSKDVYGDTEQFRALAEALSQIVWNRIFKMFQRLDTTRPGIGMGLAVCKKIAESDGGSIWAKSDPGKGSTFYFTMAANT
jgi:signal transduction histidine kinase